MQLAKPEVRKPVLRRVHVQVADPVSRKSKTVTIYETTPNQVVELLKRAIREEPTRMAAD